MSKITFRADEDLVERLEAFEASKSEVMREALRAYLDAEGPEGAIDADDAGASDDLDEALAARVDELVERRLDRVAGEPRDVNVNVTVDGAAVAGGADRADAAGTHSADAAGTHSADAADTHSADDPTEESPADGARGEGPDPGRKTDEPGLPAEAPGDCARCGESLDAGDVFCPNCGEKAAHRSFCECGDELRSDWAFCPGCGRRTPAADVLDRT